MNKVVAVSVIACGVLTFTGCVAQKPAQVYQDCYVTKTLAGGNDREGSSGYRVFTKNCGTFKVEDYWGRTNSSDVFGQIIPERTYDITAFGNRNTSWSEYPNIVSVEEVEVVK